MTQLWLVPADEPSFQETLAQARDLTEAPTNVTLRFVLPELD